MSEMEDGDQGQAESAEESPALTAETALQRWRDLTEQKSAAETTYEEQIAPYKAAFEESTKAVDEELETIEAWFLTHAEAVDQDSFSGDGGTVTITARENPKITDGDAFFTWADSTDNSSLLQKRISVTEFRKFQAEHPGEIPPGVAIETSRSAKFKPAT